MLEKLRLVESRYLELENMSGRPDFYDDPKKAAALLKEQRSLEPVVTAYRKYNAAQKNVEDMLEMLSMPLDPEMKELCQEELAESKAQLPRLEQELKILLLPKDPNDDKNVILEIRAGVGGEESALFAHSLYRMYAMYAEKKGWNIEITTLNETELGGVKELVCMITGQGAYSRLKFETGVHRVQRVPETESGGRVHTSTATVAMMPEVDEVSVELNPADIKMEVFRSSGAGGQHINKTSSAVRLIHLPTNTVVECQQERSQVQNREKAMRILYSRLYQAQQEAQAAEISAEKRSQVGMGMRNEKIRTYNFPQSRVTDHRIGLTLYKLGEILDGNLDEIIDALITADQAEKLQHSQEKRYAVNTKILDPKDPNTLDTAADIIRGGGLLGIPTETVYGLGANGLDADAVLKIFEAKGRPQDNPLILHVAGMDQVENFCPRCARAGLDADEIPSGPGR